jgi:putative FmdB family regulatory protein
MPRYVYKCDDCEASFMVRHSIKETVEDCKVCGNEGCVTRTISNFTVSGKESSESGSKVGSLVKKSIEEFRSDLNRDREKIRGKDYEPEH